MRVLRWGKRGRECRRAREAVKSSLSADGGSTTRPRSMILLSLLLAAQTGTLAGKVTLSGLAPKLANLPVTRDMKTCGNNKPDESLAVGDGGAVKNAVIWFPEVSLPRDFKPGKEKLDQQLCVFVPHVLAAPIGTTVDVVNSDKALHNVRVQAGA